MSTEERRRTPVVGATVICLLAGLLFGTSASLAREHGNTGDATNLVELIRERDRQVRSLAEEADDVRAEVEELQARQSTTAAAAARVRADQMAAGIGLQAVSGPALSVTLDDAGYGLDTLPEGYTVDDVVVHQQDLQGVVNALWAGGAEAIMVQDQRIVSTSSVQCVGNTLYLQGRVYSPPYTITAIGDTEQLQTALAADPTVTVYRQWADEVGLGYAVTELGETTLPAFEGSTAPKHVQVVAPEGSAPTAEASSSTEP